MTQPFRGDHRTHSPREAAAAQPARNSAPYRAPVLAAGCMVAASHPAVSAAGLEVLATGGNAVDAAIAMAAMSWIALPGQCGVGGDVFAVVREPDGSVWTVNGSGAGPDGGDRQFYRERGLTALPTEGPLAVATPGAVSALASLHRQGGTRDLAELWARAVAAAETGLPCTRKTRDDIRDHTAALARDPGAARVFLPAGRPPAIGRRIRHPDLAATLRTLAKDPADFYSGGLAEQAIAALRSGGAPFSGEEWAAAWHVTPEPAIAGRYQDRIIHQTPLPTPGWMVLQQAAICDGWLAGLPWLDAESIHVMAGAARIAFNDRLAGCASDNEAWRDNLASATVAAARDKIAFDELPIGPTGFGDGDTTSVVTVDADGRAVSLIHSLAFTFGARVSIPGTGVLLNNRLGRGAYLIPGHPNEVRPGRRPLHTLNAWLVTDRDGRLLHVGNTPGGDGQVQWNMQLLSHLLDHEYDPQQAVDAPRFTVFPGSDADVVGQPPELRCESRLGDEVLTRLRGRGHDVRVQGPWEAGGSALIVSVDHEQGILAGGADSRQEGVALGL